MPESQPTLDAFLAKGGAGEPLFPADFRGAVRHPRLRPGAVGYRAYQVAIAESLREGSTLVVVPTGLGKTLIAVLAAADALQREHGKVLVLAPTRPLVDQHATTFENLLLSDSVCTLTGSVSPTHRAELFTAADVVVATPQCVANDVAAGLIDLREVGLLVVDEAHRSVGEYAYVAVGKAYAAAKRKEGAVLALTASPGAQSKRIQEVIETLGLTRVEVRRENDPDVAPYLQGVRVEEKRLALTPAMLEMRVNLEAVLRERIALLQKSHFCTHKPIEYIGKKDLVEAGNQLQARLARGRSGYLFGAMLHQGVALQAAHSLDLLETQGCAPLHDYMARLLVKASRSQRTFMNDPRTKRALELAEKEREESHPKMGLLVDTLRDAFKEKPDQLVIVFAQFRDTVRAIADRLAEEDLPCTRFVGQATKHAEDPGLDQDMQREVLKDFREGKTRILVSTQVAEEGLDVPAVDLVVFYEPIPSEIRSIQRRGRTGRARVGRVVVLIAEGTRDEGYLRISAQKEQRMTKLLGRMQAKGLDATKPRPPRAGEKAN